MSFRRSAIADAEPEVPGWRMAVDELFVGRHASTFIRWCAPPMATPMARTHYANIESSLCIGQPCICMQDLHGKADASQPRLTSSLRESTLPARRQTLLILQALKAWIEGISEGIAQQVKAKNGHAHGDAGKEHQPGGHFNILLAGDGQHTTP